MTSTPGAGIHGGLVPTPGQTIGPFFGYALPYDGGEELVPPGSARAIRLHGTVYDGAGDPVPDALLELWQADENGRVVQQEGSLHRDGWTFTGWGRASVDGNGHYSFSTVRPGADRARPAAMFMITIFAPRAHQPPVHPGLSPRGHRRARGRSAAGLARARRAGDPDRHGGADGLPVRRPAAG